jgi:hypothetical protein
MSQLEFLLPTQSGLFDIVQKSTFLLIGFASQKRGFLRGAVQPKIPQEKWLKRLSKPILDFNLSKGVRSAEFREGGYAEEKSEKRSWGLAEQTRTPRQAEGCASKFIAATPESTLALEGSSDATVLSIC